MNAQGLLEAVRRLGVIEAGAEIAPLSGGVSSDVFLVRAADGREFVVKRSIPVARSVSGSTVIFQMFLAPLKPRSK